MLFCLFQSSFGCAQVLTRDHSLAYWSTASEQRSDVCLFPFQRNQSVFDQHVGNIASGANLSFSYLVRLWYLQFGFFISIATT